VTDVKSSDDHVSKTLKLSLADPSGWHKPELFLFDAQPQTSSEETLSTLLRVTQHNVHCYSSEPAKALNHVNLLWKSFSDSEPICLVLLRVFRQIVMLTTSLDDQVKDMLLHFVDNSECVYRGVVLARS